MDNIENTEDLLIFITENKETKNAVVYIRVSKFIIEDNIESKVAYFIKKLTEALLISQDNGTNMFDIIVDCENATSKNVDMKFGKNFIKIAKQVFNNNLGVCVIINIVPMFKHIFTIIKPLIDKPTRSKIIFQKKS